MELSQSGQLTFFWQTSCESAFELSDGTTSQRDHAEFLVDGEVVATCDGESAWEQVSVNLSGGKSHTVTWRYVKDGSGSAGEDCVWVSDIQFASIDDEETTEELDDESEYNWFYEENPVSADVEHFEYLPSETPEESVCQIDAVADFGEASLSALDAIDVSNAQAGLIRVANVKGLNYAALVSGGWIMLGNERLDASAEGGVKFTAVLDYGKSPSTVKYLVSGLTLTNAEGVAEFACHIQKERVTKIATANVGEEVAALGGYGIKALAGKYEVRNADLQCATNGEEVTYSGDIASTTNGTLHVAGGGTLVIPGETVPESGIKRKVHVDANSAIKFDFMHLTTIPTVLRLVNGVGSGFIPGNRIRVAVPGEGVDRISKVFNRNGNLEARIAERPTMDDSSAAESPFSIVSDGETSTAATSIGNAVEGFWYGLETTEALDGDFSLDSDSVKQCTSTGSMKLESSANANSDSGFYRVSVSAEEP